MPASSAFSKWRAGVGGFLRNPLAFAAVALLCGLAHAEVPTGIPQAPEQPLRGALVIVGGGGLPDAVRDRFLELAGGRNAHLVVIPTARQRADQAERAELLAEWKDLPLASLELLHTRSRQRANENDFIQPLKQATAVWLGGGDQSQLAAAYLGTAVERELKGVLDRGGVIGGTSAGAAVMSRLMIQGGTSRARLGEGLGLLSTIVIDQHFLQRNRVARLLGVIDEHPGYLGLGIDERTAVIIHRRELRVLGESYAVVLLSSKGHRPLKVDVLRAGDRRDLVALSRAALDRARPPSDPPPVPAAGSKRTLLIGGGGHLGLETYRRFIDLAGGPQAPIVLIATAVREPLPAELPDVGRLRAAGALNLQVLNPRTAADASDATFLISLRSARGIWFTGGRQWRLIDAYLDTPAERAFHELLDRGGVIGGSSAGASIQASYLVRGSPFGNDEMMAEGYERGFGFLPGVAIDQHFTQRDRHADMPALIDVHPELLGIGIDEHTAIVVNGSVMEIIGQNQVAMFERRPHENTEQAAPQHIVLKAGERYDINLRKKLASTNSE